MIMKSIYLSKKEQLWNIPELRDETMLVPLQLEVLINLQENKKRGFFETSEKDRPPMLAQNSVKFTSNLSFEDDKIIMLKIFEYLLISFFTQWFEQYTYRKYSDLKDYAGETFIFYQDGDKIKCDQELPKGVLNSLLMNIYGYTHDELLKIEMKDDKYREAFYTVLNQSMDKLIAEAMKKSKSDVVYNFASNFLKIKL